MQHPMAISCLAHSPFGAIDDSFLEGMQKFRQSPCSLENVCQDNVEDKSVSLSVRSFVRIHDSI